MMPFNSRPLNNWAGDGAAPSRAHGAAVMASYWLKPPVISGALQSLEHWTSIIKGLTFYPSSAAPWNTRFFTF